MCLCCSSTPNTLSNGFLENGHRVRMLVTINSAMTDISMVGSFPFQESSFRFTLLNEDLTESRLSQMIDAAFDNINLNYENKNKSSIYARKKNYSSVKIGTVQVA